MTSPTPPAVGPALPELVARARWHRRWRLGDVFVAVGELDGRVCALESLPENTLVDAVPGHGSTGPPGRHGPDGTDGPALAELLAAAGPRALYTGLPGRHRLADLIADPAADREQAVAAAGAAGRRFARLHATTRAPGPDPDPVYLRLLRAELRGPRLLACRRTLDTAPAAVRAHCRPLLDPTDSPRWADAPRVPLHGSAGPGAVFVGADARDVALTRWIGSAHGDPMYDLGTFLGPLVELTAEQAAIPVPRRFAAGLAHALLAGYADERGAALTGDERSRLWSRTVLNLVLHLCYFTVRHGRTGDPGRYVEGISALVAAGPGPVLDGALAGTEVAR